MVLDDPLADRQAQPGAMRLAMSRKGFEQLVGDFGRNARDRYLRFR